ncbi:primosomal protein N' [Clostridiales Family XIII bacterium PM5-7]
MRIKEITYQNRRDFQAIYECEHCGHTVKGKGYDDDNFHRNVVPDMICRKCKKAAPDDFRPMGTLYPEGYQI